MIAFQALSFLKLSRIDTCFLITFAVFAPALLHSGDLYFSFTQSIPLLPMSMCAFVLNDIHDAERDRINHPDRIIPSGKIGPKVAILFYFLLLVISLLLIKVYIPRDYFYWYLLLLILYINYNYVVTDFPSYKNIYVSITAAILIYLLSHILVDPQIGILALSIFLFIFGRELLMDVLDAHGDGKTLAHKLGDETATSIAFIFQIIGIGILLFIVDTLFEMVAEIIIITILVLVWHHWKHSQKRQRLITLMKVQLLIGIIFLIP